MELHESLDKLLVRAITVFESEFGRKARIASCAPGRVNIIGEHTDYNDGFVFPMALPLTTVVVGAASDNNVCRVVTTAEVADDSKQDEFSLPTAHSQLQPGKLLWANYVRGVVACFPKRELLPPFDAVVVSSVPLGGGLSSSASLEVAVFTFLESLVSHVSNTTVKIDPMEKALCCQKAEHTFANMPCGIMDQFISTMAKKGHALLIDCRSLEGRSVPLSDAQIAILITNSNVRHELSASEYPIRRKQCEEAAAILGVKKLRDVTLQTLEASAEQMDGKIFARARHVISENQRCEEAAQALEVGDFNRFGRLMTASHTSLRDDYEVSCTELDQLVSLACEVNGVYGSRMTGGGFGGCTVTLVRADAVNDVIQHIQAGYSGHPQFYVCQASDGAQVLDLDSELC